MGLGFCRWRGDVDAEAICQCLAMPGVGFACHRVARVYANPPHQIGAAKAVRHPQYCEDFGFAEHWERDGVCSGLCAMIPTFPLSSLLSHGIGGRRPFARSARPLKRPGRQRCDMSLRQPSGGRPTFTGGVRRNLQRAIGQSAGARAQPARTVGGSLQRLRDLARHARFGAAGRRKASANVMMPPQRQRVASLRASRSRASG